MQTIQIGSVNVINVSCFIKIQNGLPFWYQGIQGGY